MTITEGLSMAHQLVLIAAFDEHTRSSRMAYRRSGIPARCPVLPKVAELDHITDA